MMLKSLDNAIYPRRGRKRQVPKSALAAPLCRTLPRHKDPPVRRRPPVLSGNIAVRGSRSHPILSYARLGRSKYDIELPTRSSRAVIDHPSSALAWRIVHEPNESRASSGRPLHVKHNPPSNQGHRAARRAKWRLRLIAQSRPVVRQFSLAGYALHRDLCQRSAPALHHRRCSEDFPLFPKVGSRNLDTLETRDSIHTSWLPRHLIVDRARSRRCDL